MQTSPPQRAGTAVASLGRHLLPRFRGMHHPCPAIAIETSTVLNAGQFLIQRSRHATCLEAMLADSSVNIGIKPWVAVPDFVDAGGEINKAVLETFRVRNIVIPFPQREIRLLGGAA